MTNSVGPCTDRGRQSQFLPIRVLGFIAICIPTITVYLCIISTFFTHSDKIDYSLNRSYRNCPQIKSILAPVSYSIASWEPQRQLWALIVIVCLPARVVLMMMIPRVWWESSWRFGFYASSSLEMIGLVLLSLFHDQSKIYYYLHFASFGWWWMATLCVMAIVVYMQQATGLIDNDPCIYRLWLVKIAIFCAFVLGSCTISLSYPLASTFCSLIAFTIFCLGEYTLIALNAVFWALLIFEFSREFEGFQVLPVRAIRKMTSDTKPEISVVALP